MTATATRTPREAITATLQRFPYGTTARVVTGHLRNDGYLWPTKNADAYPFPSYERVESTLRAMLAAGQVTRTEGPDGFVWRLADATELGVAALAPPGRQARE